MAILMLTLGLAVLTAGAEFLVRGASRLATGMGVSPLIIGLTIVAFGTSAPELVVSVHASLNGQSDVALGNVVGSNIFNVLFILGISAMIVPLRVSPQLIRVDVPILIGISILVFLLASDGRIGRPDGMLLTAGLMAYTTLVFRISRKERAEIRSDCESEPDRKGSSPHSGSPLANLLLVITGLVLLVAGSRWFIDSTIAIARHLGVSELVISVTLVAAGTSLPEVAASVMAAVRGERDIAAGNVIGSNLFNILGVLGLSGLAAADGIRVSDAAFQLDIPVMIAAAAACLPVFYAGHIISRRNGAMFLGYYAAYTVSIVIAETTPELYRTFVFAMVGGVVPLTIITLITGVIRSRQTISCH